MPQRRLLQIGGLTFDSDITKFLLIIGAMAFAAPVVWWCGAQPATRLAWRVSCFVCVFRPALSLRASPAQRTRAR